MSFFHAYALRVKKEGLQGEDHPGHSKCSLNQTHCLASITIGLLQARLFFTRLYYNERHFLLPIISLKEHFIGSLG